MSNFTKKIASNFLQYRNLFFVVFTFCMVATLSFFMTSHARHSSAANLSSFQPGNIISDAVMANYNAMSEQDIQNFLNSKNKCDNRDYNLYLQYTSSKPNITWHWEGEPYNGHFVCLAEERFGETSGEIGTGKTAARIIYEAAQKNRINPQILLVLLQKESSLITDKVPNSFDYGQATGYGCPDTAACDKKYAGFSNQVHRAAELFRYVLDHNSVYYPAGRTVYVGYHPNASCGGTQVYIENRATAALYQYTPYQPNAAALAAGYGQGNSCSAYGNRNFYLYFTDWFGSTQNYNIEGEEIYIIDGEYSIVSAINGDLALNARSNNAETATFNINDKAQRWKITRNASNGHYQIINSKTGQPLITQTTNPQAGTNVSTGVSSTCSKWWKIYKTKDNYAVLESTCANNMVLHVKDGSNLARANTETYSFDNSKAQKWQLIVGQTIDDGVYTLSSSNNSQKMVDIEGGWSANGTNIQLWEENHADAQKWRIEYNNDTHYYTLTNPDTNKRFDLSGENTSIGTNIHLWQAVNACSQYWQIIQDGEYYTILSSCAPGRAADLVGGYTTNTTNIRLWDTNGANAQKWQLHNQQVLTDGDYEVLSSGDHNYAIDIEGGWNQNAVNVNLYKSNGVADAQLWRVRYNKQTGDYTLLNQSGNRSLDLEGGWTNLGTNIQIWDNNTACAQRWTIVENSDRTHTFVSTCNHERALDLSKTQLYNTNNIRLWQTNFGNTQRWYFNRKINL